MNRRDKAALITIFIIAIVAGCAVEHAPEFVDRMIAKYCKDC